MMIRLVGVVPSNDGMHLYLLPNPAFPLKETNTREKATVTTLQIAFG